MRFQNNSNNTYRKHLTITTPSCHAHVYARDSLRTGGVLGAQQIARLQAAADGKAVRPARESGGRQRESPMATLLCERLGTRPRRNGGRTMRRGTSFEGCPFAC